MITLYGVGKIFPQGIGETKDLRAQWALEETGLPYRVHALDHTGGELDTDAYRRLNPFRQLPVLDDDGFIVTESAAIVLYLYEKAGAIPADLQTRTRITQWCFAAIATVESTLVTNDFCEIFDGDRKAPELHDAVRTIAGRWLAGVEERLADRQWLATDDFSAADLVMAGVLRMIRKTDMLAPYPHLTAYFARCQARPAWQRALQSYADRVGVPIDSIR